MQGYFFKPVSSNNHFYLCIIEGKKDAINCKILIREIGHPQRDISNGEFIEWDEFGGNDIISLDVWGKYYFPFFITQNPQWYHNDDGVSNYILAQAEVLEFALNLAKKIGNIIPY